MVSSWTISSKFIIDKLLLVYYWFFVFYLFAFCLHICMDPLEANGKTRAQIPGSNKDCVACSLKVWKANVSTQDSHSQLMISPSKQFVSHEERNPQLAHLAKRSQEQAQQ